MNNNIIEDILYLDKDNKPINIGIIGGLNNGWFSRNSKRIHA